VDSRWIPDGFHGMFQVDSMECQAIPLLEYIYIRKKEFGLGASQGSLDALRCLRAFRD